MNKENNRPTYGIAVDAACSGNPGMMEYRGVHIATGEEVFRFGPFYGTNNIGECLALCYAKFMYGSSMPIYSDSTTAIKWVKDGKHKSTLVRNKDTELLYVLLETSLSAVAMFDRLNIRKWNTKEWGEIPADFGRKK